MQVQINAYLGVIYTLTLFASTAIVVYYAEPGFPWHSYPTLILGYFTSFAIMLLVPIDIASVVVARRAENNESYNEAMDILIPAYSNFFTIILVMNNLVLVFEEYYNTDGYFSVGGKLWSSFKRMVFDLVISAVAGAIVLGILIGKHVVPNDPNALQLTAVILTNTVYETFLMFLLAYGLVEFPRSIWIESVPEAHLLSQQHRAAQAFKTLEDDRLNVSLEVSNVIKTKDVVKGYGDRALLEAMDIILSECPPEFKSSRLGSVQANKKGQVTIDTLASLRTRLNTFKDTYRLAEAGTEESKKLAYRLEDIVHARATGSETITWSLYNKQSTPQERRWLCVLRPILLKVLSVLFALLSLLSFIGVVCSIKGIDSQNSPYFQVVHSPLSTPGGIVIFIFLTLGYTAYVTSWALFKMRLAGMMVLVPFRTTPEGLSFNVRMCARLAAPLAFFYLGWISENGIDSGDWLHNQAPFSYQYLPVNTSLITVNVTNPAPYVLINGTYWELETIDNQKTMNSAFSLFYSLQSVSVIKNTFGTLFPVILFILLALFVPNIFNRLLVLAKLDAYQFGAEIATEEQLREGKRQLERQKKMTARKCQRENLKTHLASAIKPSETSLLGRLLSSLGLNSLTKSKTSLESAMEEGKEGVAMTGPREPPVLAGVAERKDNKTFSLGNSWIEIYVDMQSPTHLRFHKLEVQGKRSFSTSSSPPPEPQPDRSKPPERVFDIKLALNFNIPKKKGSEGRELEIEFSDETVRIRLKTAAEAERWVEALKEWKDYAIDYAQMYDVPPSNNNSLTSPGSDEELGVNPIRTESKGGKEKKDKKGDRSSSASSSSQSAAAAQINLDSIVLDEVEEEPKGRYGTGMNLFGGKKKDPMASVSGGASFLSEKPTTLEGWLEKKNEKGKMLGNEWQRRYCRIDESKSALTYFKSDRVADKAAGSIDLRLVVDVVPYVDSKGRRDDSRFNIDMGEGSKVYKWKANGAKEGEKWVEGLNAWRDYFVLNSPH